MTARVIQSLEASDVDAELASAGVPADMRPAYWAAVRGNTDVRSAAGQWWSLFENGATAADVAEEDHEFVREALAVLGVPPYSAETWSDWTSAEKESSWRKGKALFFPLRLAFTGQARGPEMADVMPLLQKKPSLD